MADSETTLSARLNAAAMALTGPVAGPGATELLRYLHYDDGDAAAVPARARMLRAAASFRRLFRLPMQDAPGLVFFGGEADPADLGSHSAGLPVGGFAGSGLDPRRAFEACVGEGIEYLSQFAQPDDPLQAGKQLDTLDPPARRFVRAVLAACAVPTDRAIDWIQVRRLTDGVLSWFPADLCLRRSATDFVAPLKLSTGCAAGVTLDIATRRGLLELIERDAVALWWRGGRRPRTIARDSESGHAAASLLTKVRSGQTDRKTVLLDITTDLNIPVVAAFSTLSNGYGFALGMAARPTRTEAVRSAIFELCQSELSLHVIAAKRRESGQAALNESDLRQYARASMLDTRRCLLLQPDDPAPEIPSGDPLQSIVQRLSDHGIVAHSLDLTRPRFGVPVVRVIAPGLQSEPCDIVGERLARTIEATGGGAQHTGGIALL